MIANTLPDQVIKWPKSATRKPKEMRDQVTRLKRKNRSCEKTYRDWISNGRYNISSGRHAIIAFQLK